MNGTSVDADYSDATAKALREAASRIAALESRLAALREAAGPFVRVFNVSMKPFEPDDDEWAARYLPKAWPIVGDFRALARALEGGGE